MRFLLPKALIDGQELLTGHVLACEDDTVLDILPIGAVPAGASLEPLEALITPSLFDVQVNGGGGIMLNNKPTREGVRQIAQAHNAQGTAYLLPTVMTDSPEVMERAAWAVTEELGRNGVLGIHIEGPHINVGHGGAHNPAFIRPFDDRTMAVLRGLRQAEVPVLLTLAPEVIAPGLIARLTAMGVIVSAGHSAATAGQTRRALSEGLRCFTHLFNGMPQMTSREPMITGSAINSDAWCSVIADGFHVCDEMVRLATRARPVPDRMILVSDAMSTVGGPDHFELYGEIIRVEGGRLINRTGSLAGAHTSLAESAGRLMNDIAIPVVDAVRMVSSSPFEMMKLNCSGMVGSSEKQLGRIDAGPCISTAASVSQHRTDGSS